MTKRWLCVPATALLFACGKHVPVFVCGGMATYPRPEQERCATQASGMATLVVQAVDVNGDGLPAVFTLTPAGEQGEPISKRSGASGEVTFQPTAGFYALTVVYQGFVPQVRPLKLTGDCTGYEKFTLQVVPWFE